MIQFYFKKKTDFLLSEREGSKSIFVLLLTLRLTHILTYKSPKNTKPEKTKSENKKN